MKTITHFHNFIEPLPADVRAAIAQRFTERRVAEGDFIYRQGEPSGELFQIVEGAARICNYTVDGKEAATVIFRPGDCFGELGVLDGLPRVSYAMAEQDCLLQVLSKRDFDALYAEYPELGRQITLMLCRRVRGLMGMNEDAISLSLYERLGRALQRMTFSHGQKNDDDILFIEISHEDLGKTLGASRQSVSKELKQLESQGMIKVAYGRILIVDLEALTERFEQLLGMEQLAPAYAPQDPQS